MGITSATTNRAGSEPGNNNNNNNGDDYDGGGCGDGDDVDDFMKSSKTSESGFKGCTYRASISTVNLERFHNEPVSKRSVKDLKIVP